MIFLHISKKHSMDRIIYRCSGHGSFYATTLFFSIFKLGISLVAFILQFQTIIDWLTCRYEIKSNMSLLVRGCVVRISFYNCNFVTAKLYKRTNYILPVLRKSTLQNKNGKKWYYSLNNWRSLLTITNPSMKYVL